MSIAVQDVQLTPRQAECVNYKGSDLLIRGIPGSGKTVVLLRRARKLAEENPGAGIRVRVFTFNKTLAKYSRDLVTGLGNPSIEVVHFHSWASWALRKCGRYPVVLRSNEREELIEQVLADYRRTSGSKARILDQGVEFFKEELTWVKGKAIASLAEYEQAERKGRGSALRSPERKVVWGVYMEYENQLHQRKKMDWDDFALELLNRETLPEEVRSEFVLVDEAQDLQESQLRLLRRAARQGMTIAADEAQKIYRTSFTWQSLGINIRGSGSKRLTTSFRSTANIIALAASLRSHDPAVKSGAEEALEYEIPQVVGTNPVLYATERKLAEEEVVLNLVRQLRSEYPKGTIGILARQWRPLNRLHYLLDEQRIPYEWIKEDEGDVTSAGVKLSTFHSAKGLEFDFVILTRLTEGIIPPEISSDLGAEEEEELLAIERRLLYVSMTRAKFSLYMTTSETISRFIGELDPNLYSYVKA